MRRTMLIGAIAATGAFAGALFVGQRLQAADEIRCRVNAEALIKDLAALRPPGEVDRETLKKLLQPKAP